VGDGGSFEGKERKKRERSIEGGDEDLEGSHGDAWRETFEGGEAGRGHASRASNQRTEPIPSTTRTASLQWAASASALQGGETSVFISKRRSTVTSSTRSRREDDA
jgi:hypothetical protein